MAEAQPYTPKGIDGLGNGLGILRSAWSHPDRGENPAVLPFETRPFPFIPLHFCCSASAAQIFPPLEMRLYLGPRPPDRLELLAREERELVGAVGRACARGVAVGDE